MNQPECSNWNVWVGKEIEGETSRGQMTLFVRELPSAHNFKTLRSKALAAYPVEDRGMPLRRIWFCEEFIATCPNWNFIECAVEAGFTEPCVCVTYPFPSPSVSWFVRTLAGKAAVYLKLSDLNFLSAGDHVCIGKKFADEAFALGQGRKVVPEDYRNDIRIA